MNWQEFLSTEWYRYLDDEHKALVRTTITLLEKHESLGQLEDYSFLIFPIAKVYEAFLKRYFLDAGLITQDSYYSKRLRIGRALNPDIRVQHRDEWWLYDDIVRHCGKEVGDELWKAWLEGRNRTVHSFPGETPLTSLATAEKRIQHMSTTMELALKCALEP